MENTENDHSVANEAVAKTDPAPSASSSSSAVAPIAAKSERDQTPFWMTIRARHVFTMFVFVAGFGVLYLARDALGPYILAIVLAYIILPIVRRVESAIPQYKRIENGRRPVATLVSVAFVLASVAVLLFFLARPIVDEVTQLADSFPEYWTDMTDSGQVGDWYVDHVPEDAQSWINSSISELGQRLLNSMGDILSYLFSITGSIVEAMFAFVIVPVFMVYFLIDRPGTEARIRKLLPEPWVDDTIEVLGFTDSIMASYTRGVILTSLIVGVITGLGYFAIGIDVWVSLGVIAFVGEIVPILGPWIAFFISFPIILVTQPDKAILAALVFGLVQAIEGWFISPKIQGDSIELPASMVLVALAIGAAVAGPIGIVVALPVSAILRAIIVYVMRRLDGAAPGVAAQDLFDISTEVADETPLPFAPP